MTFDPAFDNTRLQQLTQQVLSGTDVTGRVLFFAEHEAEGISRATWQFEDEDHETLQENSFKFMLMELLDTLIQYRHQHDREPLCGVVAFEHSTPSIQWLTAEEVEALLN